MIKLPNGYIISEIKIILSQKEDSAGRTHADYQDIEIEFIDAGGGFYPVISTERWAFDKNDLWNWVMKFNENLNKREKHEQFN